MNKERKQKIKMQTKGQKSLKTCKTCGTLLTPYSESNYCSDNCKKQSLKTREVVLNE